MNRSVGSDSCGRVNNSQSVCGFHECSFVSCATIFDLSKHIGDAGAERAIQTIHSKS